MVDLMSIRSRAPCATERESERTRKAKEKKEKRATFEIAIVDHATTLERIFCLQPTLLGTR